MCGISGYFAFRNALEDPSALWAMNRAIASRGPDGEGAAFIDTHGRTLVSLAGERTPLVPADLPSASAVPRIRHDLAFGHRRFAIVELTPGGHQPHVAGGGLMCLSFQGEIYNHVELREELVALGHVFHSHGDAEVLAHAWLEWGPHCLTRLRGFWALSVWDGRKVPHGQGEFLGGGSSPGSLWLARDPIGKAPLYWSRTAERLWWASEIKGIRAGAGRMAFPPRAGAVSEFIGAGLRDFENRTFFEGIETFPAGSVACVRPDGTFTAHRYWSPPRTRWRVAEIGPEEAVSELATRLTEAVSLRLRADVPVGIELSGGMDSSAIAALAARERSPSRPLAAFTVAFPGTRYDESHYARRVAEFYRDRMTLTTLTHDDEATFDTVAGFHREMDEPFHSPVLVLNREIWKRMAAAGMRVSLNGAGGDEVFAGYGHEYLGPFARDLVGRGQVARAFRELAAFSERDAHGPRAWARAAWWMTPETWRRRLRPSTPPAASNPLRGAPPLPTASDDFSQRLIDHLGHHKMNYWLRSGNTATMGIPIESRLPLLDVRVIEWAARLPGEYLIRDGWLKWALRRAVAPYLPHDVTWRKVKMGFPFPLTEWLRSARPRFEYLRHGEDPPHLDRAQVFAAYESLTTTHPVYLWRCLSVLIWWDECVAGA